MKTIVFAHPWEGSLNKAILDRVIERLSEKKEEYTVIDLYRENFNPVLTEEDLKGYSEGRYTDPLVGKYQEIIKKTDELIFIFPIWWSSMPGILKGFIDKVMLREFAYRYKGKGIEGLLSHIRSASMITTASSPKFIMRILGFGMTMKLGIFGGIGIKKFKWLHCSLTFTDTDEKRRKFLDKVKEFV